MSVVRVGPITYAPDVDTDGGIEYHICTLRVKTTFEWDKGTSIIDRVAAEDATSLHVFPKKWKECVAQVPTCHGQPSDYG